MVLNLSNFIHSLLLENETVIIPGFGAFVSTYKPADIKGDVIIPPSKAISFSTHIKNNDGLLVEIIARKAKISQLNAMKRIEKARENMLYQLDNGEQVILENIGTLSYDKNNEIQFTPFEQENLLVESFGFEKIPTTDIITRKISESEPIIKTEKEPKETILPIIEIDKSKSIEELNAENKNLKEPEPEKKPDSFKLPEFKTSESLLKKEEEKRKKAVWYWYLLILIPVFIGLYFLFFNKKSSDNTINPNKSQQNVESQTPIIIEQVPAASAMNDSLQNASAIEETDSVKDAFPTNNISDETGTYHLIGGGFEEMENIDKFILELKEKGINGYVIGMTGNLHLVAIGTYNTEEEAQKSLNQYVKENPDWKIWIYHK